MALYMAAVNVMALCLRAALTVNNLYCSTGPFVVFNEPDEEAVLRKFIAHIQVSSQESLII